jgi:phosphomannomutase
MPLIRSLSGLRATVADSLPTDVIHRHALAFAARCAAGPIVVGRDGRPSGRDIQLHVVEALRSAGRTVLLLDLATTPTVQVAIETHAAAGGISITASHNPEEWNGLKFIGHDGVFLSPTDASALYAAADAFTLASTPAATGGQVTVVTNGNDVHIQRVLDAVDALAANASLAIPTANGERVVVDAVNASGSVIVPALLRRLGYSVVELYCDASGHFPHTPEPLPQNLTALAAATRQHGAVLGVAVDPDGDRLVLFDEAGTAIGEELTIALATQAAYALGANGPCVVNYSTTRVVDDVAAAHSQPCYRSPVGEINVIERMRSVDAVIGGEGSGGVILPACHAGRDSLVGIALITALLRLRNTPLSQAVAALPRYAMRKHRIDLPSLQHAARLLDAVQSSLGQGASISTDDGVHLAWPERWLHVRSSNTEPIMRIIAEAPDAAGVNALVDAVVQLSARLD